MQGEKQERMLVMISDQASSGLSTRAYCELKGIKPHTFYYWQRKFREEQEASHGFHALLIEADSDWQLQAASGKWLHIRTSTSNIKQLLEHM